MENVRISSAFLDRIQPKLTWTEVAYGFERNLIHPGVVIDYAIECVAADDELDEDELAIASASVNDSIVAAIQKLASRSDPADPDACRLRWAKILVAWVYENRNEINDPLSVVEEIYTDFDYPDELASFVRYMPSEAPDLGSPEANEGRMLTSLGEYVEQDVLRPRRQTT